MASRAIDGFTNRYYIDYLGAYGCAQTDGSASWWKLDMGQPYTVALVRISNMPGTGKDHGR